MVLKREMIWFDQVVAVLDAVHPILESLPLLVPTALWAIRRVYPPEWRWVRE
ncbi:MAG TPA: hypothetical protein VH593_01740 [Ktedonobacteraceae bacterium]